MIINGQTYLNFTSSFIPERDINGNLISITSSYRTLNEEEQFFPVNQIFSSSYTPETVDSTFSELISLDEDLNIRIPSGAILISESVLFELEENIILLESQTITLQSDIGYLNILTGSLNQEIEQLYEYINMILGGETGSDPHITTGNFLPDGIVNTFYNTVLNAVGGIEPYSWTILSGSLPPNIVLNQKTGQITGIPLVEYNNNIKFQVTDLLQKFDTQLIGLKINLESPSEILSITTKQIPDAHINNFYTFQLTATGSSEPYTWSIMANSLPNGLELLPNGIITGTANTITNRLINFKVEDNSNPTNYTTKDLRIKAIFKP